MYKKYIICSVKIYLEIPTQTLVQIVLIPFDRRVFDFSKYNIIEFKRMDIGISLAKKVKKKKKISFLYDIYVLYIYKILYYLLVVGRFYRVDIIY